MIITSEAYGFRCELSQKRCLVVFTDYEKNTECQCARRLEISGTARSGRVRFEVDVDVAYRTKLHALAVVGHGRPRRLAIRVWRAEGVRKRSAQVSRPRRLVDRRSP